MTDMNDAPIYDHAKVEEGIARCVDCMKGLGLNWFELYQVVHSLDVSVKSLIEANAQRVAGRYAQGESDVDVPPVELGGKVTYEAEGEAPDGEAWDEG